MSGSIICLSVIENLISAVSLTLSIDELILFTFGEIVSIAPISNFDSEFIFPDLSLITPSSIVISIFPFSVSSLF